MKKEVKVGCFYSSINSIVAAMKFVISDKGDGKVVYVCGADGSGKTYAVNQALYNPPMKHIIWGAEHLFILSVRQYCEKNGIAKGYDVLHDLINIFKYSKAPYIIFENVNDEWCQSVIKNAYENDYISSLKVRPHLIISSRAIHENSKIMGAVLFNMPHFEEHEINNVLNLGFEYHDTPFAKGLPATVSNFQMYIYLLKKTLKSYNMPSDPLRFAEQYFKYWDSRRTKSEQLMQYAIKYHDMELLPPDFKVNYNIMLKVALSINISQTKQYISDVVCNNSDDMNDMEKLCFVENIITHFGFLPQDDDLLMTHDMALSFANFFGLLAKHFFNKIFSFRLFVVINTMGANFLRITSDNAEFKQGDAGKISNAMCALHCFHEGFAIYIFKCQEELLNKTFLQNSVHCQITKAFLSAAYYKSIFRSDLVVYFLTVAAALKRQIPGRVMVPMDFSCFVDWGYVPKMEMFTAIFNGHKEGLTLELPDQELGSLCQVEVKLLDEGYVSRLCNMMYNFHKGSSKPWSQDLHVLRIRDFFMCNLDVFGVEHRKYVCNIYCQVICLSALSLEPKSNGFRAHILKGLYYSYPESMQSVIDSYPSVKKYFRTHGIINKEDSVCEKLKISYLLNA